MTWQPEDERDVEDIDEDDADDEAGADELPCPSCGQMVFEDTDRCPYCGDWIMPLADSANRRTWLWWMAVLVASVLALSWAL